MKTFMDHHHHRHHVIRGRGMATLEPSLGHPQECEENRASRVAARAGELPFSNVASRWCDDTRAPRIAGRDARS